MSDRALTRCVGDIEEFFTKFWARRPLHRAGDGRSFEDLITFADLDELLASRFLRLPAFRIVKDGATIPSSRYTRTAKQRAGTVTGIADPTAVHDLFYGGATLVFEGVHRYWPQLRDFCRDLELSLGHPVQVNIYVTPPRSQGFAVHSDEHDVFVLQIHGSKRWEVYDHVDEEPSGRPLLEADIHPGDCLYIPEDWPHAAKTTQEASAHLTVGILCHRWIDVVKDVITLAERHPDLQERLDVATARDPALLRAALRKRLAALQAWIDEVDDDDIMLRALRRVATTRHELVTDGLRQALLLPAVADDTPVRRRRGSTCILLRRADDLAVVLADRELRMPLDAEPAMRFAQGRDDFRVGELSDFLDQQSRLVLVRRLIREGLLEAVLEP